MITQIQGDFNSTPAMTFKRIELKGGKTFLKNWKLKCWCTAPWPTHSSPPSQARDSLQPASSSAQAKRQHSSTKLPLTTKPHFLQHCSTTRSPCPYTPPHELPMFWPVTSCSSQPLCNPALQVLKHGSQFYAGTSHASLKWPLGTCTPLLRCYTALASSSRVRIIRRFQGTTPPNTSAGKKL